MKALITGGAGFIGSHLSEYLLSLGHFVTTVDTLSTGQRENISHLLPHERFRFVEGSVTDRSLLKAPVEQCDIIFHLAAVVGVKLVVSSPLKTLETNVRGTEIVLQVAQEKQKKVLLASSSEVYGKGVKLPFNEDDDRLLGPTSSARWSYAASKALDEFMALAYHQEYGLPVVIFRLFNTVGPRQTGRYGMVIPRFVQQALNNEPLTVYGNGEQTRCFCDVADAVRAITALATAPEAVGKIFNIGNNQEISIARLAQEVINLTGSHSNIQYISYEDAYGPGFQDMARRVPDIGKIKEVADWQPTYSLTEILERVIAYYKEKDASGDRE
jgi:UDP-glucose 4-epimerase